MINVADMTFIELAGFVGDHLGKQGINVVLSGGTCVAHYSKGKYVSIDLDEIKRWSRSEGKCDQFEQIRERLKRKA